MWLRSVFTPTAGVIPTVGVKLDGSIRADMLLLAPWAVRFSISRSASGLAYRVASSLAGRLYNVLMFPLSTASLANSCQSIGSSLFAPPLRRLCLDALIDVQ